MARKGSKAASICLVKLRSQSLARPSPDHPFRGAAGLTRQAPDGSYAKDRRAKSSTSAAGGRYRLALSQKVDAASIVTIVLPNGCQPWGTLPKLQGLAPIAITPHKPFRTFTGRSGRHICLLAPRAARETGFGSRICRPQQGPRLKPRANRICPQGQSGPELASGV